MIWKKKAQEPSYDFVIEFCGRDVDDEVFDALYEAGCDDGLIGQFLGVDRIHFIREAPTYCEAVRSAIENVQSVPGLTVTRVVSEDDAYVALTEAINAVLASPESCPDVSAFEEQSELRRLWEDIARAGSDRVGNRADG